MHLLEIDDDCEVPTALNWILLSNGQLSIGIIIITTRLLRQCIAFRNRRRMSLKESKESCRNRFDSELLSEQANSCPRHEHFSFGALLMASPQRRVIWRANSQMASKLQKKEEWQCNGHLPIAIVRIWKRSTAPSFSMSICCTSEALSNFGMSTRPLSRPCLVGH